MLNWSTRDEDYISWDIEVLAEGILKSNSITLRKIRILAYS